MFAPNYTQIPNSLLDHWLPHLSDAETKVLLVIMRKTFGWHKVRDRISLSQLEKLTGKKKQAILKASKRLEKIGLISKTVIGKKGSQETYYELILIEDSKNSYQCDLHTPPSVIITPTKETLSKDIPSSPPIPPIPLFQKDEVSMSLANYERLLQLYGKPIVDSTIEDLARYAKIDPPKFKRYRRHDLVVEVWIKKELKKEEKWKPQTTRQSRKSTNFKPDSSVNASREFRFVTLDSILETPKKLTNGSKETKDS
jgi:phage replication O-like protein O